MESSVDAGQYSDASDTEEAQNTNTQGGKPSWAPPTPNPEVVAGIADVQIVSSDDEEEYDEDWYLDDNDRPVNNRNLKTSSSTNTQAAATRKTKFQPSNKLLQRYSNKIYLGQYEPPRKSYSAGTNGEVGGEEVRRKDKQDRATAEQVWDIRTRSVVDQMMGSKAFNCVEGCISTGKEANVYYAKSESGREFALKIYRTSILTFKDRDKYITGDFRFQHGYNKRNPRKMVQIWADKERRNLCKLDAAGIRAPQPQILKKHVLLMDFIGAEGQPAPKLKDALLTPSGFRKLYRECVEIMWRLYNISGLVHADLSEYNLLYHNDSIVVIDVSQAVEKDHPMALVFLRTDCTNMTNFFREKDVAVMNVPQLFNFITDPTINEENLDACLDAAAEKAVNEDNQTDPDKEVEEEVFKKAYIPQNLKQVINAEKDIKQAKSGTKDLLYKTLVGLRSDLTVADKPEMLDNKASKVESDNEETDDSDEEESDEDGGSKFVNSARPRNETAEEKKLRKKAVKEQQAEKRKIKMKKHEKKRREKLSRKK